MRQTGGPRRLPHILQAIEDLGEARGSSAKHIIDQVESTHYGSTDRPKNLTGDVRKALKYAVDNGLVKERAGKFSVASFYGNSKLNSDPSKSIYECRRRRKRKGQRRRRRHRRHASLSSLSDSEASLTGDEFDSDRELSASRSRSRSPQFTGAIISHRRRRRRRKHSHHRRRRGRKHALNDNEMSPAKKDGRCLAHHQQDCDSPGCQRDADDDFHGSYIN